MIKINKKGEYKMLALMFMSFFEIVIAVCFFGIYIYETVCMKKWIKHEQQEEITVYQKTYYKRTLINLLSDAMFITFLLSVVAYFTLQAVLEPEITISYWYMALAAVIKVYNRKTFYK